MQTSTELLRLLEQGKAILAKKAADAQAQADIAAAKNQVAWETLLATARADFGPLAFLINPVMPEGWVPDPGFGYRQKAVEVAPFGAAMIRAVYQDTGAQAVQPRWIHDNRHALFRVANRYEVRVLS